MEIIIVIFKSELQAHPHLAHQLGSLCQQTTQIGQACAYVPKSGEGEHMLALLQEHNIRFSVHQNGRQVRQETDDRLTT